MDKIILGNLVVNAIIGVYEWERVTPQKIIINIEAYSDLRQAGYKDSYEECIDYEEIASKVKAHAETARRLTVEALAEDIARLCLADNRISKVVVRVEKPAAIEYVQTAGVEIERFQQ